MRSMRLGMKFSVALRAFLVIGALMLVREERYRNSVRRYVDGEIFVCFFLVVRHHGWEGAFWRGRRDVAYSNSRSRMAWGSAGAGLGGSLGGYVRRS